MAIDAATIPKTIKKYLKTIPSHEPRIEVGFFGGSFTGIPAAEQRAYLGKAAPFLRKKVVHGIRLSTRPDYIDQKILNTLKAFGVTTIELGVQSMSDDVLKKSNRGHKSEDVLRASRLITKNGFRLVHQMMIGLPGSSQAKEIKTARSAVSLKANEVRIYPVIVIKNTHLARLWKKGLYRALSEEAAIKRSAALLDIFDKHQIPVIRLGLHPSEGLVSRKEILAGPFHEAFRQKVETFRYGQRLETFLKNYKNKSRIQHILYNPLETAYVIGYGRANAKFVDKTLSRLDVLKPDDSVKKGRFKVVTL